MFWLQCCNLWRQTQGCDFLFCYDIVSTPFAKVFSYTIRTCCMYLTGGYEHV